MFDAVQPAVALGVGGLFPGLGVLEGDAAAGEQAQGNERSRLSSDFLTGLDRTDKQGRLLRG